MKLSNDLYYIKYRDTFHVFDDGKKGFRFCNLKEAKNFLEVVREYLYSVRTPTGEANVGVKEFLERLGLERYSEVFLREEIDESILPHLQESDLTRMGIEATGTRRKILEEAARIRAQLSETNGTNEQNKTKWTLHPLFSLTPLACPKM